MLWSFLEAVMAKDPMIDGARAMVKRFFQREQLNAQGKKLQNDKEVVTFLYEHLYDRPKSSTLVPSNLST
jgi:hypothetical protein